MTSDKAEGQHWEMKACCCLRVQISITDSYLTRKTLHTNQYSLFWLESSDVLVSFVFMHSIKFMSSDFFFLRFTCFFGYLWRQALIYVGPEISVEQAVNIKIKTYSVPSHLAVPISSSLLMISVSHWSFVSKLCSLKCRYLTAVSIPAMKVGKKPI